MHSYCLSLCLFLIITFTSNIKALKCFRHLDNYKCNRKIPLGQSLAPLPQHHKKVFQTRKSDNFRELHKIFEARALEFAFPSQRERHRAIETGQYNVSAPIPIDVDVYYSPQGKCKVFWTIPRFGEGVPYSIAYIATNPQGNNSPELQPFPSYSWHRRSPAGCSHRLTSVFRIYIDPCGQMWVLDSGEISLVHVCAPSIAVFDLETENLIYRYYFPQDMYKTNVSRFVSVAVDFVETPEWGACREAFVFSADATGYGFVVSHVLLGSDKPTRSWRIENKYTLPELAFGTHTIAGESFELIDGTFTFSITPPNLGVRRMLYFHSFSSDLQMAIPLDIVRNGNLWNDGIISALDEFMVVGRRGNQCGPEAMTVNGFQLCGQLEPIGIFAWNIRTPYTRENRILVAENPTTLQFVSGLKVIRNPRTHREEVWIGSNRLQKAFTNRLNFNEINFRIQCCNSEDLFTGRKCRCDQIK